MAASILRVPMMNILNGGAPANATGSHVRLGRMLPANDRRSTAPAALTNVWKGLKIPMSLAFE